jgi:bifunctional enzyme CysN/CysC
VAELQDRPLPEKACTVWLTGLSGAGKSTIAEATRLALRRLRIPACLLDGDRLRSGLSTDLGMSHEARSEQARRVAHVAAELARNGIVAIVALISPYESDRQAARGVHQQQALPFYEIYVDTPAAVCESRDPKHLYSRARRGEITGMTGVDAPYEPPSAPELRIDGRDAPEMSAQRIVALLA